jgi:sulfonate dioxygenase
MASITYSETTQAVPKEEKLVLAFDQTVHESVSLTQCFQWSKMLTKCLKYKYADYLPVYDNETKLPPLEPSEFTDRGISADEAKPNLLPKGDSKVVATKLTPLIGTEIQGLQLSHLTDTQKNELALLIAERGVVIFRDQDFKDIGAEKQKAFGSYFGKLHIHVRLTTPTA